MKKKFYIFLLLLFSISKYSTAQVLCIYCYDQNDSISYNVNNLLLNGGFENTNCIPNNWFVDCFCPNSSYFSCTIANWTCTGGGTDTYANITDINYAQVVEGTKAAYLGNDFCRPCSIDPADTSCLNKIDCTVGINSGYPINTSSYGGSTGISLEQNVVGLIPGNTYVLEFWAGGEYHGSFFNDGLFAVDVGFGDTLLRNKPTDSGSGIGTRFIVEFIASSASHTIKFTNWGHICADCTELIIDDVRLYSIAELSVHTPHCTLKNNTNSIFQSVKSISPNPATDELKIEMNDNTKSEIIIYDFTSRIIIQKEFTNSITLNIDKIANGVYLYEVRNINGSSSKGRIIKQ